MQITTCNYYTRRNYFWVTQPKKNIKRWKKSRTDGFKWFISMNWVLIQLQVIHCGYDISWILFGCWDVCAHSLIIITAISTRSMWEKLYISSDISMYSARRYSMYSTRINIYIQQEFLCIQHDIKTKNSQILLDKRKIYFKSRRKKNGRQNKTTKLSEKTDLVEMVHATKNLLNYISCFFSCCLQSFLAKLVVSSECLQIFISIQFF